MTYSKLVNNIDEFYHNSAAISSAEAIPTISYHSLKKSLVNLQGLINFYFPLQGLSEADFPRFMPILIFVEATIYQIDEEYENHIDNPQFISKHISVFRNVLTQLNLFDDKLENELQQGLTYYRLEQQFCSGATIRQEDIDHASLFKCFDFGILHRLLLKLTDQPYDEEILQISRLSDQICKICADLKQYKQDIRRNVINTYRMFVRLYGSEAAQHQRHYLETLNSKLRHQLKILEQTKPDMAKKFIELWNADLKLLQLWNSEFDDFAVPEIPEPILEEQKEIVASLT